MYGRALRNARLAAGVLFLLLASGCAMILPQTAALRDSWPATLPERAEVDGVPFFPQEEYQCGPAALATVLVHAGVDVTPSALVPQVYLPSRHGSLQIEMLAAPRKRGIVSYALEPSFEDLLREVASGNPVVFLEGVGLGPFKIWHYAVVVGYDRAKGEAYLRSGVHERLTMPFAVLEYTWKESDRWAMVTMPPDRIPVTADEARYLDAVNAMARVATPAAAARAYAAFLVRWPASLAASVGLANALHASGDLKGAENALRTALGRDPRSVIVLNNLAQTLSDEGRDREALAVIDQAAAIESPFGDTVRETRAAILRKIH